MSARPHPREAIDQGVLSADEDRLRELSGTDRILRNRLILEEEESADLMAYLERMIRQRLAAREPIPWDLIEGYADSKARLGLVRDKRERFDL